jgi:NADPH-dependent 2,4-dienoyl-CoA reductase/sulfur reductase-like enzyme
MMICSIGVNPNVDFLEKSVFLNEKIATLENGAILINNKGETNLADVYSGGDCASVYHKVLGKDVYIPLATTANKIGRMIADSICEKENNFEGTIGSSSLKVCGFEVAKAGISEQEAILNNIAYKKISFEDYNHTNYYPNQQKIYIKILFNPENFEILGAQMVGKDGVALRMHVFSLAIIKKISIKEFGNMDFGYSPPFSRVYDILNIAGNLAK